MKVVIGHLCPDLLNLYGDTGNIQCLVKRCEWRGIEAEVKNFECDDVIDFSDLDIVLLGGGSDYSQQLVCRKLQKDRKHFTEYVEHGGVVIAVCGGYQLLGHYYQTNQEKMEGLHILDIYTEQKIASKFSSDIRLLSHLKEVDEPFEEKQIGSSAMAYKRNPLRSECIASLARYVICDLQNTAITAASQWFERTLDDSANKRLAVPEAFLATDAILNLYINVIRGLKVYPAVIRKHMDEELQCAKPVYEYLPGFQCDISGCKT